MVQSRRSLEYHSFSCETLRMKLVFFCTILLWGLSVSAQNPSVTIDAKPLKYDTNYIVKYLDKLVIGIAQSEKHFDASLIDTIGLLKNVHYFANSAHSIGLSIDYDIFGLGFDVFSYPIKNDPLGGKTDYKSFSLNFNVGRFRSENSIKYYKGFYDQNSHIDTVKGQPVYGYVPQDSFYYYDPSLSIFMFKSKGLYVLNKRKFSLGSAYASVARQLKTAFTWMLAGSIYTNQVYSDSGLIPRPLRPLNDSLWRNWNNLQTSGLSFGGGASVNFVIKKKWFLNLSLNFMLDLQRLYYSDKAGEILDIGKGGGGSDARASFGYNARRFFFRFLGKWDVNNFSTMDKSMQWHQTFYYGEFSIGWRFGVKTPGFYQRFQNSKLYKRWA